MFSHFRKNKSAMFLLFLVVMLLAFPFFQGSRVTNVIFSLLYTTLLLSGIYAVSDNARAIAAGTLLLVPVVICLWSNIILENPEIDIVERLAAVIFMIYTLAVLLTRVLAARRVGLNEIYGAICAYILIGGVFGIFYILLEILWPGSFHFSQPEQKDGPALFYFSFVTLTTAGFGDITAAAPFARSLVIVELIIGVTYMAVLIGRLVSASFVMERGDENLMAGGSEKALWNEAGFNTERLTKGNSMVLILASVMLNLSTSVLMIQTKLPFFLDSCGTMLAVILGGWRAGILTAFFYHLVMAVTYWGISSWQWLISSFMIASVIWVFCRIRWIRIQQLWKLAAAGTITGFLNGILVQVIIVLAHLPPYIGTLRVYKFFLKVLGHSTPAAWAEKMFVEVADKLVCLLIASGIAFLLQDFAAARRRVGK